LSEIKKLAGHTVWYGLSSIGARFISYLLTPLLTYSPYLSKADFGRQSLLYSAIPVLTVIFTYGLETAYFRFSGKKEYQQSIYSTAFLSLFFSTIFFGFLLWINKNFLAGIAGFADIPTVIQLTIFVVAIDTLSAIPYAKLRLDERPIKYAFVRVAGIFVNLLLVWFLINYCPAQLKKNPDSWVGIFFSFKTNPIIYIVFANIIQSVITLFLLGREIACIKFKFNVKLWKEMMLYSLPLVIVGLGGIVNETFDRILIKAWLPGTTIFKDEQVGIYNACYKLSLLITLFVQAFRMGAEPFFFKQAHEEANPQRTYARVMKFFVIVITFIFLMVALFLPVWKFMIGEKYREGIKIVPVLLLANMFLGIYYNLSIWYKLGNRTIAGTYITLIGTAITFLFNYLFIPRMGYFAGAWATFLCYFSMMVISYIWGQKEYPVPYPVKKLLAYIAIVVGLFFVHKAITHFYSSTFFSLVSGVILTALYTLFILKVERKEMQKLPVIGRFIKL
jgi:O-antigen/teichoic acid export membrane protein